MLKISIVCLCALILCACPLDFPIPYQKYIELPFSYQQEDTWCGVACVQMWAMRDGNDFSQPFIASYICGPNGKSSMEMVAEGIGRFTNSPGHCGVYYPTDAGQDEALADAAGSLSRNEPAILPFYGGTHAVIARGFEYTKTLLSARTVVKNMTFHDPGYFSGENYWLTAGPLKEGFFKVITDEGDPYGGFYQVVVCDSWSLILAGYKEYLRTNGTFYGGPDSYIPDGSEFIRILYPLGSERIELGAPISISWESNALIGNIKLELLRGDLCLGVIASNLPIGQGKYVWTVGQYQGGTAPIGDDYKIKITMMDGSDYDTSNVDFSITPQLPDVIITNVSISPASPTPGSQVTVKATIKNQGPVDTPSGVYVGTGFSIDGNYLGAFFVKDENGIKVPLAADASYLGSCTTLWTATAGTHTILATADDADRFTESNEGNNTKDKTIQISEALPDVIIEDIWLELLASGTEYKIHARIKNKGTVATPTGIDVGVGFKVDGAYLGAFFVKDASGNKAPLAAGDSFNGICTTLWIKAVGTHTFWAKADDAGRFDESNEGNNVRTESISVP